MPKSSIKEYNINWDNILNTHPSQLLGAYVYYGEQWSEADATVRFMEHNRHVILDGEKLNYLKQKKTVAESEAQARDSQGYKDFLEDMKKTVTLSNSLKVKVKVIEYALTMQQSLNKVKLTEMRHS